jgi:hypothetical protein
MDALLSLCPETDMNTIKKTVKNPIKITFVLSIISLLIQTKDMEIRYGKKKEESNGFRSRSII